MPTVAEVLKQTGMTDEQIAALPPTAITGFNTLVTTATEAQERAELAARANRELYDQQIAPALDGWGNEKANMQAELAFYKAQVEGGKAAGFVPADAPTFAGQQRNQQGQFVEGANPVPGSPQLIEQVRNEASTALGMGMWAMQEYQRVTGQFLPDDVTALAQEASAQRMPFRDYVEKKYDFAAKRQAKVTADQEARDKKIREEAIAENNKQWAERGGTNPNVRQADTSQYAQMATAVGKNERPDPLKMSREQRHVATRNAIRRDVAEGSTTIQ